MPTLHLTRGLPASGKTTWARMFVAQDPATRVRVNRDDVRAMLHNPYAGQVTEQETTRACHAAVRAYLRAGKDVICDDTNLNAKFARALLKIAHQTGADVQWRDFPIDLNEAILRDDERRARGHRAVGADVIRSMHQRYIAQHDGLPPRPHLTDTDLGPTGKPYTPVPGTPKAVIVDIDGTVAHNDGHRSFYDCTKVAGDGVHQPIVDLVWQFDDQGYEIIFVSGREDSCFDDTVKWLLDRCDLAPGAYLGPFMRATGDGRNDAIVKLEIFDRDIRDYFDVRYVLDDRNRVVAAWRSIGLTVLQVADGDF